MSDQNRLRWRSAVLEGFAVLLGILLAFGIDAAWDARQEREAVGAALTSLGAELDANRTFIEYRLDELRADAARTERYLVDVAASPTGPVTQDSLRAMTWHMGPLRPSPPQRSALDDLVSGGLRGIRNGEIRRLILSYGQALERDETRQESAEAWFDDRLQTYVEVSSDLVGMGSLMDTGWDGRSDLGFAIDSTSFVGNRRYGNLLAERFYRTRAVIHSHEDLLALLLELQRSLPASEPTR